jgi:phage portal protein BeeE
VERIEAGLNWLIQSEGLPPGIFVKLSLDGLLRGDTQQRLDGYETGLRAGFYTINEVRDWEELPPLPEAAKGGTDNE